MTLEDHAGDVVRKARFMSGIGGEAAAAAAGLDAATLEAFERSGTVPPGIRWEPLAALLDLHASKLVALAHGWMPRPIDLSEWREIRCLTSSDPDFTVHCYLVWDEVTREAALFDTGFDADSIFSWIEKEQLDLQHLFLTHTHNDHIAAMGPLRARFPKLRLHTSSPAAPPQHRNRANDFIHLGSLRISNRATPGHADDGVTYVIGNFPEDAPHVAVVGDAIYAGSIGGAAGKGPLARGKIREAILSLPAETLLCPGHGPLTTVGEQMASNPFFS